MTNEDAIRAGLKCDRQRCQCQRSNGLVHCPVHDADRSGKPDLSVSGKSGKPLVHCHVCRAQEPVIAALRALGLWQTAKRHQNVSQTKTGRRIVATYDFTDENGELLFQVVRYHPKEFRQRRPDGNGGWIWNLNGTRRVLYRLPEVIAAVNAGHTIYITEGEEDADGVLKLGLCSSTNAAGAGKWHDEFSETLRGAECIILPDNDPAGKDHAQTVARSILAVGAQVKVVELPDLPPKGDISDWIASGGTKEELLRLASGAPEIKEEDLPSGMPRPMNTVPEIVISNKHRHEITTESLSALVRVNDTDPFVFSRGSEVIRINRETGDVERLNAISLGGILDRAACYLNVRTDPQGGERRTPARPPTDMVADLLSLPDLPLPELLEVRQAPVFLPGGQLLSVSGYDARSRIYLAPVGLRDCLTNIPPSDALRLIRDELLGDFPFADDASIAHAISLMLLPFVRPMIDGATPLHLIDAPARGTGKGLLADVVALVCLGMPAQVMALTRDGDELEKRITALLVSATPMILLDNVRRLDAACLDAVLTTTTWTGRILGQSKMVTVPNRATWTATGNNVELSDEMLRRVVPIRLDSGVERPEERTNWRHPDLTKFARTRRAELVGACLSIIQVWVDSGMPNGERTLGRYESWSRIIGGILRVSGVSGFLDGRERLHTEADRATQEWIGLCNGWWEDHEEHPVTAGDVFKVAKSRNLLLDVYAGRSELAAAQRVGYELQSRRDRVFGDFVIHAAGRDSHTGNAAYRLQRRGGCKTPETPDTQSHK